MSPGQINVARGQGIQFSATPLVNFATALAAGVRVRCVVTMARNSRLIRAGLECHMTHYRTSVNMSRPRSFCNWRPFKSLQRVHPELLARVFSGARPDDWERFNASTVDIAFQPTRASSVRRACSVASWSTW